eukprot:gnl/MRDRNA2_/MRDRNA2_136450_c0_seq1.p1 gnl/MRDRNA2_/MRDRNA2_136450_c0~~gnl/MRDRNA2_/MRDRNA2_136450_c0_seq1.p1  ORF type:complete len:676 (+),score=130.99 gnl/MRDRNA2_/MRDRNA2_136450_c0_seq1:83-2029(+)
MAGDRVTATSSDELIQMISFFKFHAQPSSIERVRELVAAFNRTLTSFGVLGLVWVAPEGINAQLAVPLPRMDSLRDWLGELKEFRSGVKQNGDSTVHINYGDRVTLGVRPFKKLKVKLKRQVLTDGLDKALDWQSAGEDVPPEEWDAALDENDAILLDCRNDYETEYGCFVMNSRPLPAGLPEQGAGIQEEEGAGWGEEAQPLGTEQFSESWDVLRTRLAEVPRNTPILTYCTGGIRCVKVNAWLEQEMGFNNTKRLQDGVIGYLRHKGEQTTTGTSHPVEYGVDHQYQPKSGPIGAWRGSNFVFDRRELDIAATVAVDMAAVASASSDAGSIISRMAEGMNSGPAIIYGTAWQKENAEQLVSHALRTGFRGMDTSCQPNLYNESAVGQALAQAYLEKWLKREDVWLQTKFVPVQDQDPHDVPYDKDAPLEEQVRQSVAASLHDLQTQYLDVLLLQNSLESFEDVLRVWRVFEEFHDRGTAKFIGISNCNDPKFFQRLYESARVKPTFLQNRFYSKSQFDPSLRRFCIDQGVKYESFWILSVNKLFTETFIHSMPLSFNKVMTQLASKYSKTPAQIYFAFTRAQGIIPVSGAKTAERMRQDLELADGDFNLDEQDVAKIFSAMGERELEELRAHLARTRAQRNQHPQR